MTLSEFKAWFEGFTEGMDTPPDAKQWARVKERVGQISGAPISYPVYIDRYAKPWWGEFRPMYATSSLSQTSGAHAALASLGAMAQTSPGGGTGGSPKFDSHAAMHALGKADQDALAA